MAIVECCKDLLSINIINKEFSVCPRDQAYLRREAIMKMIAANILCCRMLNLSYHLVNSSLLESFNIILTIFGQIWKFISVKLNLRTIGKGDESISVKKLCFSEIIMTLNSFTLRLL